MQAKNTQQLLYVRRPFLYKNVIDSTMTNQTSSVSVNKNEFENIRMQKIQIIYSINFIYDVQL